MEDTVWPHEGRLEDYVEAAGAHYSAEIEQRNAEGKGMLEIQASFRTSQRSSSVTAVA